MARGENSTKHAWAVLLPWQTQTTELTDIYKSKLSLLSGVHQQAEADKDDQQVDVGGLIPGFVHRVVYGLVFVAQNPVSPHSNSTPDAKPCK